MTPLAGGIAAGAVGVGIVQALTAPANPSLARLFGIYYNHVTFEENSQDVLTITEHPVELGAEISDHAFMNPYRVSVLLGWDGPVSGQAPINECYKLMRNMQQSRVPFSIVTGRRAYKNMLIESIESTTDADTENVLKLRMNCKQVIIVSVTATQLAPAANQKSPQNTAATTARGTISAVQAFPAPNGAAIIGTPIP